MTRVAASDVRDGLRRAEGGRRVIVRRRGKDVAAIVPLVDLRRLEELEDRADAEAAREALAEMERAGTQPTPWAHVKREAGL